jgi:hypothetical protein
VIVRDARAEFGSGIGNDTAEPLPNYALSIIAGGRRKLAHTFRKIVKTEDGILFRFVEDIITSTVKNWTLRMTPSSFPLQIVQNAGSSRVNQTVD